VEYRRLYQEKDREAAGRFRGALVRKTGLRSWLIHAVTARALALHGSKT